MSWTLSHDRAFTLLGAETAAVWQGCELLASLQAATILQRVRPEHQAWVALWALLQRGEPVEAVRLSINARPFVFSAVALPTLEALSLSFCSIDSLDGLKACPRLSSLHLTRTQHGGGVLRSQTLRTLEITDSSAESFTLELPALEALTVRSSLLLHALQVPAGVRLTLTGGTVPGGCHDAGRDEMKVGIIGTGWVGTSVAISLLHEGVSSELLLHDVREGLAEGEAMDLRHGAAFYPNADVRAATIAEMCDADAVVIAAGRGGSSAGESRLALLKDNVAMIRALGEQLSGARGIVLVVSNPVDVLTRVFTEASGLPPERVLGTGTTLDTARLRQVIGARLKLSPRSVHAQVIGEHGDSEVVLWSSADVGGSPLHSWPGWELDWEAAIALEVRHAAYEIIARKGATNHAIGLVTADLLQCVLRNQRRVLTVSRCQSVLGLGGVALSLPAVVGRSGASEVVVPPMDPDEEDGLSRSAAVLHAAYAAL
jgi:L-lactate dehydrogenase